MGEKANTNVEDVKPNEIDILGRDEFVDNCRLLINTIFDTTKSAFIMIDGEWGVGKTFVMNMLDKELKNKYTILKYNCWENSYYNDPLEAILSVMIDYIDDSSLWSNANKEKFRALGMVALNLLSLGSVEILNKAVEKAREYVGEDKNSIYTVIQEVKSYINSNKEKIIILVDEIDRCLPEFGVKTLERLYLLFRDAPNIILIIANDKSKMEMSIKNAFGYKSIDNYLEKFIDYTLKLNTCEKFKSQKTFNKKYSYYLDKFELYGNYWELCNVLFSHKSARHIDHIISKANKIHRIIFDGYTPKDYILMAELLIVELKELSLKVAIENNVDIEKSHNALYEYIKKLQVNFQIVYQKNNLNSSENGYLCFWYLAQLAKSKNNKLNIAYFDLVPNYSSLDSFMFDNYIEKLEKYYELSLIIE